MGTATVVYIVNVLSKIGSYILFYDFIFTD